MVLNIEGVVVLLMARVLTLDGGGTRGLISLQFLKELQRRINVSNSGVEILISDYFDLIGGTSTGGFLAASLVVFARLDYAHLIDGMPGETKGIKLINYIEKVYLSLSKAIFPHGFWDWIPLTSAGDSGALQKFLIQNFGELNMPELKKVFVTALRNNCQPYLIRSYSAHYDSVEQEHSVYEVGGPERRRESWDKTEVRVDPEWKVWEALRATSAAPYYLKAYCRDRIRLSGGVEFDRINDVFTDGGQWANNPAFAALNEVRCIYGDDVEIEMLVTVGTGMFVERKKFEEDEKPPVTNWGSAINYLNFAAQLSTDSYHIYKQVQFMFKTWHDQDWKNYLFRMSAKGVDPVLKSLDASDMPTLQKFIDIGTNHATKSTTTDWGNGDFKVLESLSLKLAQVKLSMDANADEMELERPLKRSRNGDAVFLKK